MIDCALRCFDQARILALRKMCLPAQGAHEF